METATKRGYTMVEACEYLGGISRQTMYRLLGEEVIASYLIGVRRYFTLESLNRFINDRIGMIENDL
jgi:excisionase family DNA binding protein